MTTFTFRPQTLDFAIFNMVYFHNEYQLPSRFAPDDILIDIGAHTGSFAFAALVRGAGHVLSIEAHPENFGRACLHLHEYINRGQLDLRWGAVWRSDDNCDLLSYSDFTISDGDTINTGQVETLVNHSGREIQKYSLDDLIGEYSPRRIRLVKLDCEGSEFPILLTSGALSQVNEIVGEFHEFGGEFEERQVPVTIPHFEHFAILDLLEHLQSQGFRTYHRRHQLYKEGEWIPTRRGYFRARRFDSH